MVADLARAIAALKPDHILHSGLRRTRIVAERIGPAITAEPLWQERDFGAWEGQSWNRIYRQTGNAMDGMVTAPDSFHPGGGETTMALVDRVRRALDRLPQGDCVAIITHGGPIAAAQMILENKDVQHLPSLIPTTGTIYRHSWCR